MNITKAIYEWIYFLIENVTSSAVISLVSVIVATAAYLHARRSSRKTSEQITEVSLAHLKMSRKIAESEAHGDYANLVAEVELEFEEATREPKKEAREAIEKIAELLFTLDDSGKGRSYIEHRFMEAAEEVRKVYDFELTYQTGARLSFDLWNPLRLENLSKSRIQPNWMRYIRSIFMNKYSRHPESSLLNAPIAINSAKSFMELAPRIDHGEFMTEASKYFWNYTDAHRKEYKLFVNLRTTLERVHRKNRLETFPIQENTKLRRQFFRLIGDIDRYENLNLQDLRHVGDRAGSSTLGLVFAGTVILHVASGVDSWGLWTNQSKWQ